MAAQGDLSGDRLEVRVKGARGLPSIAGTDPSCSVLIEYGQETRTTETISGTKSPSWDPKKMYVFSNVAEAEVEYMVFKLVHKDIATFKDEVLGVVPVELQTVMNSPNITQDDWHPLRKSVEVTMDSALGELRIQMTYMMDDIELAEEPEIDDDAAKHKPNFLSLTVEKGRNLAAEGGRTNIDPEATITVANVSKTSITVRNDISPRWNWKGTWYITDSDWAIDIVVKDRNRFGAPVLGKCRVTMTEILAEQPFKHWVKLLDEHLRFGPQPLGEVLLSADFTYNRKARKLLPSMANFFSSSRSSKAAEEKRNELLVREAELDRAIVETGDGLDDVAAVAMFGEEREAWEKEQSQQQALALKKQKQYQKALAKIQSGDYQIQVHVIEARDLNPQDSSGTSDPFVVVKSSLGGTQKTVTQKANNSPLFDERLVFNYKDLSPQQIHEASLTIAIYDEDWFGLSRQMIGSCSFDLLGIYAKNETHEMYRTWCGLTDTEENNDEVGVQGFVKLSITVLGPGDPIPVHDLDEELKLEHKKEVEEPGAVGTIQYAREQKLQYVAVSVARAAELLTSPNVILSSRVYCRVEYAGNHINSTSAIVSSANFNQQLWVPVYMPTMATRVVLSAWKRGGLLGGDQPLGHHYFNLGKIKKCKKEGDLKKDLKKEKQWEWVNLYGAPVKGVKKGAAEAKLMAKFSDHASTYRGRLLVNARVVQRLPRGFNNVAVRKTIDHLGIGGAPAPKVALYTLRAFLVQGCEIPVFHNLLPDLEEGSTVARMKVRLCVGANSIEWGFATNDKGMVVWNEMQEKKSIEFPEDFQMIPDALIYLIRETDNAPVSFLRVPIVELIAQNFSAPPKFYHLNPDRSRKAALGENEYAGSVSIKLGFGRDEVAKQNLWPDFKAQEELSAYCLRIYVYQARGLPASDESGTLDPYVKIRFNGNKVKTSTKDKTCDPCWYEALEIDGNKLILPEDPDFCPEIVVRVWDSDGMFAKNQPVCGFHLPLKEATREVGQTATVPDPKWYECFMCNDTAEIAAPEGNKKGELLVGFQLIPKRTRNEVVRPAIDKVAETLRPHFRLVWLDILAWGVRELSGGSNPYVRFDVAGSDGAPTQYKSKRSSKPNGRNANFLERIITSIELPDEVVFTPMLNIRVYDNAYGGLQTDLVGTVSVPLENKLPWSDNYKPPQSEEFETPVKIDKAKLRMQARRAKENAADARAANGDIPEGEEEEEEAKDDGTGGKKVDSDEEPPMEVISQDPGLGAFDFLSQKTSGSIWTLPEDKNAQISAGANGIDGENNDGGLSSWFALSEQQFMGGASSGTVTTNDLPDPRTLGIDIPESWASKDWLEDRDGWMQQGGSGLEDLLKTSPFENYVLKKGCFKSNGTSTVREVGKFKGLISISEERNKEPLVPLERVTDYVCRLYVWKAESLQPADPNGKADPYVSVKLGNSFSQSGRKDHIKATLSPEFYSSYEIPIKIPGESQLKLSVYDWDRFHLPGTYDTLIGETVIDLEDRYFHKKWKALGMGTPQCNTTGVPKPIEGRDLRIPDSSNSQGKLYLWCEILPAGDARGLPPVTFEKPPATDVEVRVTVWALSGYVADDNSVDYFVKTYLKGQPRKKKETDTHYRSKTGSAQWNYRHKHSVTVPLDMPDKGDLVVELWDRNILSNESLGAFSFPLSDWLKKCYIEQKSVKPFELINEALEKDDVGVQALEAARAKHDDDDDKNAEAAGGKDVELGGEVKVPPPAQAINPMQVSSGFDDDAFEVEDIATPAQDLEQNDSDDDDDDDDDKKNGEGEEDGLLGNGAIVHKAKKEKKPENIVDVLRELAGMPVVRHDAHWFDLGVMDVESGSYSTNGQLYVSLELIPMEMAESSPVGAGRSEPMALPPPAGRMTLSMDPCSVLCALFSEYPGLVCCICGCCCCVLILGIMAFISTYVSGFAAMGL